MKIWIGGKLGVRDWIDVVLAIHSLSIVGTTLPLPDILIGCELTDSESGRYGDNPHDKVHGHAHRG